MNDEDFYGHCDTSDIVTPIDLVRLYDQLRKDAKLKQDLDRAQLAFKKQADYWVLDVATMKWTPLNWPRPKTEETQ